MSEPSPTSLWNAEAKTWYREAKSARPQPKLDFNRGAMTIKQAKAAYKARHGTKLGTAAQRRADARWARNAATGDQIEQERKGKEEWEKNRRAALRKQGAPDLDKKILPGQTRLTGAITRHQMENPFQPKGTRPGQEDEFEDLAMSDFGIEEGQGRKTDNFEELTLSDFGIETTDEKIDVRAESSKDEANTKVDAKVDVEVPELDPLLGDSLSRPRRRSSDHEAILRKRQLAGPKATTLDHFFRKQPIQKPEPTSNGRGDPHRIQDNSKSRLSDKGMKQRTASKSTILDQKARVSKQWQKKAPVPTKAINVIENPSTKGHAASLRLLDQYRVKGNVRNESMLRQRNVDRGGQGKDDTSRVPGDSRLADGDQLVDWSSSLSWHREALHTLNARVEGAEQATNMLNPDPQFQDIDSAHSRGVVSQTADALHSSDPFEDTLLTATQLLRADTGITNPRVEKCKTALKRSVSASKPNRDPLAVLGNSRVSKTIKRRPSTKKGGSGQHDKSKRASLSSKSITNPVEETLTNGLVTPLSKGSSVWKKRPGETRVLEASSSPGFASYSEIQRTRFSSQTTTETRPGSTMLPSPSLPTLSALIGQGEESDKCLDGLAKPSIGHKKKPLLRQGVDPTMLRQRIEALRGSSLDFGAQDGTDGEELPSSPSLPENHNPFTEPARMPEMRDGIEVVDLISTPLPTSFDPTPPSSPKARTY